MNEDPYKNWDGIYKDWTIIKMEKEPKNKQIEREQVLNPCKELCKKYLNAGIILKWRRLDALDMYHEDGEPDLEIWIPFISKHPLMIASGFNDPHILILLAECKREDGGVHSQVQKDYRDKYAPFANVVYELITIPEQLDYLIRKLSNVKTDMQSFEEFQCEPTTRPGEDI